MISPPPPPPPRRRLRLGIGTAVVLALVVLSAAVGIGILRGREEPVDTIAVTDADGSTAAPSGELYVHVLGAVARPGLYVLHRDARLVDAVAAAGGTTEEADLAAVNLARLLEDGEQIVVPVIGAAPEASGAPGGAAPGDERIDLNTADQAALESLPPHRTSAGGADHRMARGERPFPLGGRSARRPRHRREAARRAARRGPDMRCSRGGAERLLRVRVLLVQ